MKRLASTFDAICTRARPSTRMGHPLVAALCLAASALTHAQSAANDTPMPYYSAAQVLRGLYGQHLSAHAASFVQASQAQEQTLASWCSAASGATRPTTEAIRTSWRQALNAWLQLSTPSVGPLVVRRSLRQIDFTPIRPQLIERAVIKAPSSASDMELVGTPAKGFGALDWLLTKGLKPASAECAYAGQVAQAITREAQGIANDLKAMQSASWNNAPQAEESEIDEAQAAKAAEETGAAMAEWVNQWLGGLERLRWAQMEKPVKAVEGSSKPPAFARQALADNLTDWQTQWQALQNQALLKPAQRQTPPDPDKEVLPIEALLLGKGHIQLAQRWREALGAANAAIGSLRASSGNARDTRLNSSVLAAAARLKSITALYQSEVAPALDIPLGFSDADGD
ncbi:imelysin family protein [Ottowia thiooxydans]|uniref:imelysin family protein n=1 Tax=Ottowia thiooxydans TaxID=219182 RepID=UPI000425E45C|nr:imelysin family protein [Ottowia thiooxydans]